MGGLSDVQRYEFDVRGLLVLPGLLDADTLAHLNGFFDRGEIDPAAHASSGRHFLEVDAVFRRILADPVVLDVLHGVCGQLLRFDHASAVDTEGPHDHFDLHGGPVPFWGDAYYRVDAGKQSSGLTVVAWMLTDQPAGGGFGCIRGSHKSAFHIPDGAPESVRHLIKRIDVWAWDVIVFTDALLHGGLPWSHSARRRVLLYRYSPMMLAWADPLVVQRRFADRMDTAEQRELFRVPGVESMMAQLIGYEAPEAPVWAARPEEP